MHIRKTLHQSLFGQFCAAIIVFGANVCLCAEPPNDFLQNNFGIVQGEKAVDTGVSFTKILTSFNDVKVKTWLSDDKDQWILKMSKKDLATDSAHEMAWVFERRKGEQKPLVVLIRLVMDKEEAPSQTVAEMASNIAAQFANANNEESVTQKTLKPIEPFGGLKWTDGVVQIIMKVNQMEGIENFSVVKSRQSSKSVKGLVSDTEIIASLSSLVYFDDLHHGSYKDKDGAEHPLAVGIDELTAGPIFIKQVPFRMTMRFVSSPGFAITNPEGVFTCSVEKADLHAAGIPKKEIHVTCSFALMSLTLSSTSRLQGDKIQELTKSLKDKYKDYEPVTDYGQGEATGDLAFKDSFGNAIRASWTMSTDGSGSTFSVTYSYSKERLDQLYKSHISDLENKANSKKPDKSNDL